MRFTILTELIRIQSFCNKTSPFNFNFKMPHFRLETNITKSNIPSDFLKQTTDIVAKTLGKPESYVVASIIPDVSMCWGGQEGPCGTATLMSIGKLGISENKEHAAVLYEHIEKNLGIPKDKLYINFVDVKASDIGYNGTTFHGIL